MGISGVTILELVAFLLPGAIELGLHRQRVDVGELSTE